MSSADLSAIWEAASQQPYYPAVGKNSQFAVGFLLLLIAFVLSSVFALNRNILTVPLLGIPASLAFGEVVDGNLDVRMLTIDRFGAVYMICALGVYV